MDAAGIVQLKNGKTAPAAPVATTMIALRRIAETDFIAFYELVCACRNPQHMVFGNTWQAAVGLALAEQVNGDGTLRIHDIVRDVILSAVTGEDFSLSVGDPVISVPGAGDSTSEEG